MFFCKIFLSLFLVSGVKSQTCTCDLISGVCEVDCCCDPDCSVADNATFLNCMEKAFDTTTQICIFDQVVFVRNSRLIAQTRTNDLFCVVENTFNERNFYSSPQCVSLNSCFNNLNTQYSYGFVTANPVFVDFYKSGDPILVLYPSGAQGLFTIPSATVSSVCDSDNPVSYLFSRSATCTRTFADLNSTCTAANTVLDYQTYESFIFFATFNGNESIVFNQTTTHATVNITSDCTPATCAPQLSGSSCNNAVRSVTYLIITDGVNGIVEVFASYLLHNITSADLPLSQTFSVIFQTLDATNPVQRSGNPGYIVGRPLVVRVEDASGMVSNNSDIFLFNPGPFGDCNLARLPILFGQDQRTGCEVEVISDCSALQQNITSLLNDFVFGSNTVAIGIFGNADFTNQEGFLSLQAGSNSAAPVSSLTGCDGMVLSSSYEILFANTGSINSPQPKVAAIRHKYGNPQSIRFLCSPGSPACNQKVEVSTSVTFVDISETPLSIQRSSPTKEEQLPVSFLFPLSNIELPIDLSDFLAWIIVFLTICLFVIMLCV